MIVKMDKTEIIKALLIYMKICCGIKKIKSIKNVKFHRKSSKDEIIGSITYEIEV